MTTACVICTRTAPRDGATICAMCLGRIDDNLARIAEIATHAPGWSTTKDKGATDGYSPNTTWVLPFDASVFDAQHLVGVLSLCESWELLVRESLDMAPYRSVWPARKAESIRRGIPATLGHIQGSTAFLRAQLLRLIETADFPIEDMAAEFRALRGGLESADRDKKCREFYRPTHTEPCPKCAQLNGDEAGARIPCPAPHPEADGRECGCRLVVNMSRPADDVTCPRCRTTTTGGRIILAALSDPAVTVWAYPADIVDSLGIGEGTLRQWHRRGHIRKNGNRYDVGAAWRRRMNA